MPPKNSAKKKKQEQLAEEVKRIRRSPENLICADCPVRSTPYICIDYSSFICTECSGIHRKFNHRVKSIAVATFTEKEVTNIRAGGNSDLNRRYLARYKKNKDAFTLPREGEKEKIEKYIQLKYIDKKWYKENPKPEKKKKKKRKDKKKKRKKSLSESLGDENDDDGDDEERVDSKSPSQSNQVQPQQAQPVQAAPAQSGDMLSFGFDSPQPQAQPAPTQAAAADDWGGDWGQPQQNGGGFQQAQQNGGFQQAQPAQTAGDSLGWDPFDATPAQAAPQTQPAPTATAAAADDMGWNDQMFDTPAQPQQAQQPQPAAATANSGFGQFNTATAQPAAQTTGAMDDWGTFDTPAQPQQPVAQPAQQRRSTANVLGLYQNTAQPPAPQQANPMMGIQGAQGMQGNPMQNNPMQAQPMQPMQQGNNADDLWGAIASMNTQTAQEQEEKRKAEEAAAAAAQQKTAEKKKEFSDPFATLVSSIDGVQPSDQPPPQQQPPVNTRQQSAFNGLGRPSQTQAQMGGMMAGMGMANGMGGANPYGQPAARQQPNGMANGFGNPMMGSNTSGYGQAQVQQGNPYMQAQPQARPNPYMQQTQPQQVQQNNPYMQRQPSNQPFGGAQPQANPYMSQPQAQGNPYMSPAQPQNPYAAPQGARNPYMSAQPQVAAQQGFGGMGGGGPANPFR